MQNSPSRMATSKKEANVTAIVKKMAMVYKNLRTYDLNNPVLQDSFKSLYGALTSFLDVHGLLSLLVRPNEILYESVVVYSSEEKNESLAFNLYKDGIRLLSFREGLPKRELMKFMIALNEARDADPYQADLVTILWEKDLSYITYRAVDIFLEDDESQDLEQLLGRASSDQQLTGAQPVVNPELLLRDLGLSDKSQPRRFAFKRAVKEADIRRIAREIVNEDYVTKLRRCSRICIQILRLDSDDMTFNRVVGFVGKMCDWLVHEKEFLAACNIVSDLRSIRDLPDLSDQRRASIDETIEKLGNSKTMQMIGEYLNTIPEQQAEEVYAYLTLMAPNSVGPLCEILAECEVRKARYLLCRAISVIIKNKPEELRPFLSDGRWYFVRNIVMILGMAGNPEAIPLLYQVVAHPEARVRREVARSLGRIGSPAGTRMLGELVNDPNKMVRMASLTSMRQIADPEARHIIEPIIRGKGFMNLSPDEKREFMRTYGSLGSESLDLLVDIVEGSSQNFDEKTRAMAVYGIAMIPGDETPSILTAISNSYDGPIRYAALEALATIMP